MKKILSSVLLGTLLIVGVGSAFADLTMQKDNSNPKIKRFEVLNIKTGGSGQVTCVGEICTLDETNLTGVNWQSLNALGVAGVNWTGALLSGQGINWTSISTYATIGGAHSGINWTSFGI